MSPFERQPDDPGAPPIRGNGLSTPPSNGRMSLLEFLLDLLLCFWTPREMFRDPDRDFGCFFLLVMALLVAVGIGAVVFALR